MKDIIQTRNSFKKKHRLSAHSDDIQIDVELCSDNEEVFEEEDKNKSMQPSSPKAYVKLYKRMDSNEVPPEVVARYQQAVTDDGAVRRRI
ncbi:hypothetical protein BDFB_008553 [Asbolus verrucosus]|uniref:Uncharacterized protein n=1 Tax=Asbolus verrucosus TaxID=1661398 RepID=A0A482WCF2_ASBVE|nr:hypothetical protein BDFB_008553 [Asbolus verrucosus]